MSTFFSILCLLVSFSILLLKRKEKHDKNIPPSPPRIPIIGNLHQLGSLPHRSLWSLSKKYGPVMMLKLGKVPAVVISSVEAAEEVLKDHDLQCCSRPLMAGACRLSYNCLDVAFAPYGDYWRGMRKICVMEIFSTTRVLSTRSIREEEVDSIIDSIVESSFSETRVDLSRKVRSLMATITCRATLGTGFRGSELDGDKFQHIINEAFVLLGSFAASDFFPYVGWIVDRLTGLHGRLEKTFHELDVFYQEMIDDHLNMKRREDQIEDVIDVLLNLKMNQTDSEDAIPITHNHIKAMVRNIFQGGVETAAITIEWAMTELIRNPRVMDKVQREIRNTIGEKERVNEQEIEKLIYLKMVVKETLRLHPPTALIPRETMSAVKINGYDIPEKTRIHINVWGIGRDPKHWKSPEEFIPERFEDNTIDFRGQHFELLPFGGGRRGCPAIALGLTMVELTLANLLHCFDWNIPDGVEDIDMDEVAGLTVHKKRALVLLPTHPRQVSHAL